MQWQLQRLARSRELKKQKTIKWMPTTPVVELATAQVEFSDLVAISACRISACGVGWLMGREGSCSCSGPLVLVFLTIRGIISQTTPPYIFGILYGEGLGRWAWQGMAVGLTWDLVTRMGLGLGIG